MAEKRLDNILHELQHHFPFSVLAAILAILVMSMYTELLRPAIETAAGASGGQDPALTGLFHVFHPAHIFLSAAATSAMFWRYDRRLGAAIGAGLAGSLVVCGLSDIVFPFL
ncbi:hypothetical protein ACFL2T_03215, partial [Elusimicrobiota bacterium]